MSDLKGSKAELSAIEHAERLRKMEEEMDAANAKVKAERRRKYVTPPTRFTAPVLQTKEKFVSKGFLREVSAAQFYGLRDAVQADDVVAFQSLGLQVGARISWHDTPVACTLLNRFSASRTFQYTYLDNVTENRYEKHHKYLPSRSREFTILDFCRASQAHNILELFEHETSDTLQRWANFEIAKRHARRCAGCKQLVTDHEEHVFITPPQDRAASSDMNKSRYYHLACCRCEDKACGIVLDSDNFYLVDITWGAEPTGPTLLCRKHKLKADREKEKFERVQAAEANEKLARELKREAYRSKNPSEWIEVEVPLEDGVQQEPGVERPKYWMHKGTGYTQWEVPPIVQADREQKLLNEQQRTIYVQSTTPARDRYLDDLKVLAGSRSAIKEMIPTAAKDRRQVAEKEKR